MIGNVKKPTGGCISAGLLINTKLSEVILC